MLGFEQRRKREVALVPIPTQNGRDGNGGRAAPATPAADPLPGKRRLVGEGGGGVRGERESARARRV